MLKTFFKIEVIGINKFRTFFYERPKFNTVDENKARINVFVKMGYWNSLQNVNSTEMVSDIYFWVSNGLKRLNL